MSSTAPYWERQEGWDKAGNCLTCGEAGRCTCLHPSRKKKIGAYELYKHLEAAYDQAKAQFKVGDRYATFNKQTVEAWGQVLGKE